MIDPTCGSGHFVLGAFRRLVRLWGERQPGRDVHERVRAALDSVHGVDINPFAVAIARFRLLVAAMAAAGVRTLAEAAKYEWPIHLAVGDSLIKAPRSRATVRLIGRGAWTSWPSSRTRRRTCTSTRGSCSRGGITWWWATRRTSRSRTRSSTSCTGSCTTPARGQYALSVPFAQRFFELAQAG